MDGTNPCVLCRVVFQRSPAASVVHHHRDEIVLDVETEAGRVDKMKGVMIQ